MLENKIKIIIFSLFVFSIIFFEIFFICNKNNNSSEILNSIEKINSTATKILLSLFVDELLKLN
jgi:hypothetical protein